ncbi:MULTISPECIES: hypothetical protein [unclassified Frankia]|uniref:hypothetical protein n=1 Tax=unclassified Frankia TaxID=2632575 RepID=UPI001EF570E7|nr:MULTISPECIES: hypothetical protein [unclassified Frankia]
MRPAAPAGITASREPGWLPAGRRAPWEANVDHDRLDVRDPALTRGPRASGAGGPAGTVSHPDDPGEDER